MAAIYSNGGNRWNIFGFNFTKRDALSSVYKISMIKIKTAVEQKLLKNMMSPPTILGKEILISGCIVTRQNLP
jgi:hypothetical protein